MAAKACIHALCTPHCVRPLPLCDQWDNTNESNEDGKPKSWVLCSSGTVQPTCYAGRVRMPDRQNLGLLASRRRCSSESGGRDGRNSLQGHLAIGLIANDIEGCLAQRLHNYLHIWSLQRSNLFLMREMQSPSIGEINWLPSLSDPAPRDVSEQYLPPADRTAAGWRPAGVRPLLQLAPGATLVTFTHIYVRILS